MLGITVAQCPLRRKKGGWYEDCWCSGKSLTTLLRTDHPKKTGIVDGVKKNNHLCQLSGKKPKNIIQLQDLVGFHTQKRLILFLSLCTMTVSTYAQQLRVIDLTTSQPISDVLIYNQDQTRSAKTDAFGDTDIGIFQTGDHLTFQHPSYRERIIAFSDLTGQKSVIRLEEKIFQMQEVVVSANKWEQYTSEIPNEVVTITPKEISFRNPQTSADLLQQTGQVFVQKSQLGGGSPKLRGFSANAVLLVIDGVRMNNAIYRSGNLQNVINIDPNALESAEVIFGPGSVIYGSDALGGVMDFHTQKPAFSTQPGTAKFKGGSFLRYASANNEKTGHFHFNLGGQKVSWFSSFSFSDFDHLRTGNNRTDEFPDFGKRNFFVSRTSDQDVVIPNEEVNVQKPSGFHQWQTINKISFRPGTDTQLTYSFYYSTTSDVPRYDRLTIVNEDEPESAEWFYGPQRWMLHAVRVDLFAPTKFYDQARVIAGFQDYRESRNDRSFGDDRLRTRTEDVAVYSLNIDLDKAKGASNFFYGFEFLYNRVNSSGQRQSLTTGEITPTTPRYPSGGSRYWTAAGYFNYKWKISEPWILNAGLRYSLVGLNAKTEEEDALLYSSEEIDLNNGALNGSLGMVFKPYDQHKLSLLFSSGFRAPNVDDVGKVFEIDDTDIVLPNENLKPEFSYNWELGYSYILGERLKFNLIGFYSLLEDAIVRGAFTLNGEPTVVVDGLERNIYAQVNADQAEIYGASSEVLFAVTKYIAFNSTLSYIEGEEKDTGEPLRHTTPWFGRSGLIYQKGPLKAEIFSEYNSRRKRKDIPSAEIDSKPYLYAIGDPANPSPDDGTPGWYTLNLRASYQFNPYVNLTVALENMMDQHYRPYTSGISAPGRNFIFSLRARLN